LTSLTKPFKSRASQNFGAGLQRYNLPAGLARRLFKPSTDSASLLFEIENKNFLFWVWGSLGGTSQVGCFCVFLAYFTRPWTPIQWAIFFAEVFFRS